MAFLCLMNNIHMLKNRAMSIYRLVSTAFTGRRKTDPGKIEGGKPALIFCESGYLQNSEKMMEDYRTRLFNCCQKKGLQVLVLLEMNGSNKSCQNLAMKKVLQLVEKQYINTIVIVGEISQVQWTEIFKSILKGKVELEYYQIIEDLCTDSIHMGE